MTQIYLAISAGIVLVLGFSIMLWLKIYAKKIRKKFFDKQQEETNIELKKLRSDLGTLPYALKDFFKSKTDDYDVESFINTVYKNSYKKVLCCYDNDNFVLAALQEKCKMPIFFEQESFDIKKWNLANDTLKGEINYTPVLFENSDLDLVIYNGKELTNMQIYHKYFSFLNNRGMIIINQSYQTSYDLKLITKFLKSEGITFEVSHVKSKFLYIVKFVKNSKG